MPRGSVILIYESTEVIWQEDGAPPHYVDVVQKFLVVEKRRIGPSELCDVTPCNFSV